MTEARHLYVLRHAKSSWEDQLAADHERPLSPRGRRAVALLADHVLTEQIRPELVLCSTARRTRETLAAVFPGAPAEFEAALYGASGSDLVQRLRQVPTACSSVLIVGHNPSVQRLVLQLAGSEQTPSRGDEPESPLQQITRKFPTGALAALALPVDWSALRPGCGELVAYVRPKSLA